MTTYPANALPLRGNLDVKQCMEKLQDGVLRAIAAAARCSLSKPDPDPGIDWMVHHASESHTDDFQALLRIQLKSTYQISHSELGDTFPFVLENAHLKKLARSPVTIPSILVVMILPRELASWVKASPSDFTIRHCAYWVNLENHPVTGVEKTSVRIPTNQVFDDLSLCGMMERIGKGGKP
ncbi:DUF4365 domain-containing protein [Micromonospora sp. NBC_00858]|uniref:DUF4365 domain-containing protein n=1 Tax=Micromonospora sp. NBC_00858 TaxID=2975979 RepID=UPI00386A8775|nr:DUF4365 domain-containing protein [Micromonospora sp. NBC_00858]